MDGAKAANDNFHDKDAYEKMQFYYHPDHLGSSSYITNLDGEVSQHIEYVPFGEVFIEERNNTWNTPYLFNGKEFDEEIGMYYYGARYYEPRLSLWMSTDPLAEEYIDISAYTYCHNNPINLFDPDGQGDYYTDAGKWLGSDGKWDNMAYTATGVRKEKNKNGSLVNVFEHPVKLSIGQKELNTLASTVYAESSIGYGIFSKEEMFAIASVYVHKNKVAYGKDSPSAKAFRGTKLSKQTNAMQTANAAVINAFTPGSIDYSNGADQWDSAEQAMIPKEFQNKPSNGTFMYKMNVMGWSMRDKEYASWKNAVNKKFGNGSFNVPQKKTAGYNYRGMKNKGRIRLTSTAQYGLTIFWRTIK
jgi:RHS repeat-associated core domain protein